MLNSTQVLEYIKDNLAFPNMFLEWTDEKIIQYVQNYTLKEYSHYFPDVQMLGLNLQLESNQIPGKANEFYIVEPEGIEILNVIDIYFSQTNHMFYGHPPLGPMSQGELRTWAVDVSIAEMIKMHGQWDYTFEFFHPNRIRISPNPTSEGVVTVEYERSQPCDFRGIRNDLRHFFLELALADVMIAIGRIRKRYGGGNLRTPFGEIPLESDIYEEGKEKKERVLEKLTVGSLPNVIVDHG